MRVMARTATLRVVLGLLASASVAQMGGASTPETSEQIVDRLLTGYDKRTNPNLAAAQIRAAAADDGSCPATHDYVRMRPPTALVFAAAIHRA